MIETEIDRLRMHGVSNAELKLATGFIEGRTYLSEEESRPGSAIFRHELLGVPQSLDAYVHRIQEVTLDEIQASAREFLIRPRPYESSFALSRACASPVWKRGRPHGNPFVGRKWSRLGILPLAYAGTHFFERAAAGAPPFRFSRLPGQSG